jgi:hypothetical protein
MSNDADTCRKYVLPNLIEAGWDNEPYSFTEQKTFKKRRPPPWSLRSSISATAASLSNDSNKTTLVRLASGGTNNQVNIF